MIIGVVAFSDQGRKLIDELETKLEEDFFIKPEGQEFTRWVAFCFERHLPILFIGAAGIAVRTIAPFVKDKLLDSPILVMDEKGRYVIPILSGHIGGANKLTGRIARVMGAEAIITTATDVEGLFAVDVFAKRNGLRITDRSGIQRVSTKLLQGKRVTVAIAPSIKFTREDMPLQLELINYPPHGRVDLLIDEEDTLYTATLHLVPKKIVLGIGCKKGKCFEELEQLVIDRLGEKIWDEVYGIATIDLKKKERGLMELAQFHHVPFFTYSAEKLAKIEGNFSDSEFVQGVTGVANVCERAALCLAEEGKLYLEKQARDGMTLAAVYRRAKIITWETINE